MPVNLWDFYVGILPWILESRPDSATRYCSYNVYLTIDIKNEKFMEKSLDYKAVSSQAKTLYNFVYKIKNVRSFILWPDHPSSNRYVIEYAW